MQNVKNRAWVKNVAIIFLAALLILTFFSNTIMNRALPEVATQGVSSGSITARVRGSGTVTAVGAYELKAEQTRKVQSVLVRTGQEVNAGDVLFVLGEGESEELEQAAESLRQLELSYKRAVAGMPVQNFTQIDREISAAKEALQLAKKKFSRAEAELKKKMEQGQSSTALDDYNKRIEKAEKALSEAQANLEDVKKDVAEAKEEAWTEIQKLQLKLRVLEAREAELAALVGDENNEPGGDNPGGDNPGGDNPGGDNPGGDNPGGDNPGGDNPGGDNPGGDNPGGDNPGGDNPGGNDPGNNDPGNNNQGNNDPGNIDPGSDNNGQNNSTGNLLGGSNAGGNDNSGTDGSGDEEEPDETSEPDADPTGLGAAGRLFSAFLAPHTGRTLRLGLSTIGMTDEEKQIVQKYETELDQILAPLADNAAKLQKVRELKAQLTAELNDVQKQLNMEADARIERANEDVASAQAALDALLKRYGSAAENYIDARSELASAQKALSDLEDSRKQMGRSAASASIELQDLSEQIARARQKLEELSGGTENQIVAPVGGVIESIGYTAGNTAPKGEILCKIQVPDMGYTLSFSVSNEQARRLHTGDTATVSNYYWGSEILATLSAIEIDPQAPQTNKRLTFDLTGDVNPGSELTISVGSRSQNYDVIIPNSAIRSDTNGSFVLRLEAKNSPLGNRYFARRVDVTVLGQDDVNAAVSGDLSWGDFVITTSDRPVSVGDQVRMTDNNG